MSTLRKGHVAMSNLRFKSPTPRDPGQSHKQGDIEGNPNLPVQRIKEVGVNVSKVVMSLIPRPPKSPRRHDILLNATGRQGLKKIHRFDIIGTWRK